MAEHNDRDPALVDRVRAILRAEFGETEIGPDDRVPDVHDRSMTLVQVVVRLQEELGLVVPLESLLGNPTIAELVAGTAPEPAGERA